MIYIQHRNQNIIGMSNLLLKSNRHHIDGITKYFIVSIHSSQMRKW